jgi:hypothetical protein
MKVNIGSADRTVRILAGGLLIGLAATGVLGVWAYLGLVPLLTGAFRHCPAYAALGLSTCATSRP